MSTEKNRDELFKAALEVRNHSYSPYSNYKVACAARTSDGQVFKGINVENASYGATNCAERTAIFTAVAAGQKDFTEFLVLVDEENPWSPCGLCRQVMQEFSKPETKVYLANMNGIQKEVTMADLLPFAFTQDNLN